MDLNQNFNNFDALDIQDPELARLMEEEFRAQIGPRRADNELSILDLQTDGIQDSVEAKETCLNMVLMVFPDICLQHVSDLYDTISQHGDRIIAYILENMDGGKLYPKAKDTKRTLKRKRELDEDEEAALKYDTPHRSAVIAKYLRRDVRTILALEFPETPMVFIDVCLRQNEHRIFRTYRVLEEAERTYSVDNPPYNKIRTKRKSNGQYDDSYIKSATECTSDNKDQQYIELLLELQAARRIRKKAEAKREEARQLELAEEANLMKAHADGTISECQCCFGDYPMNRMVHCDNEEASHWFCKDCAKRNAEAVIGQSKYQLVCMATDGCAASFSMAQRPIFLDDTMVIALERNEQEANLRLAGIENLASCPFCPYAAEYPPIEIDREFRCEAPECEMVSCRLCKLESHIPKSCEEHTREAGLSVRRQIEEAMSEALIRKCNKCGTPFVKEEGCNKMTCTRTGCFNAQCYVCSKSCTYAHFNDETRGGKAGNCPLFEKTSQRHENEVKKAEMETLARIRAEHPEYTEEDLAIKVSEDVLQDEKRRRTNEIRPFIAGFPAYPGYEIHRVERPAAVVPVPQVAPGAVRPHQVPPARQLVGIQPPKPPRAKYTFDENAPAIFRLANAGRDLGQNLAQRYPQIEPPIAATKALSPALAMVPLPPALLPTFLEAEEQPGSQIYQSRTPRRDGGSVAEPNLKAAPKSIAELYIDPRMLVYKAEGSAKIPEHHAIGRRVDDNRFYFANKRFESPQTRKEALAAWDAMGELNVGMRQEQQMIIMSSDIASAHHGRQRHEMQPILDMNSPRPLIQETGQLASQAGELMSPHVLKRQD